MLEAGRRAVDVLQFLEALTHELKDFSDEQKAQIEAKIKPLTSLLLDLKELVLAFGKQGWLKKLWKMKRHAKTLVKLDKQVKRLLDGTKELFDVARGSKMMMFLSTLNDRVYPLQNEIERRKEELMKGTEGSTEDEERAIAELIADPKVVIDTAEVGNVPLGELKVEIKAFEEEMREQFVETRDLISLYGDKMIEMQEKATKAIDEIKKKLLDNSVFMLVIVRLPVRARLCGTPVFMQPTVSITMLLAMYLVGTSLLSLSTHLLSLSTLSTHLLAYAFSGHGARWYCKRCQRQWPGDQDVAAYC